MDFLYFLISWKYWKLELIDSVLKLIKLYQASELILDFWIFLNKVISSFGINFGFLDFSWNFGYVFLIWTTILDNSGLKLLLYGPRIRITQSYPGNSGSYDPYISPILEILDRTIHICSYVDVAGGRGRTTVAAAASQQLSHLARALNHHAQGPNIPFGVNPSLRQKYRHQKQK